MKKFKKEEMKVDTKILKEKYALLHYKTCLLWQQESQLENTCIVVDKLIQNE